MQAEGVARMTAQLTDQQAPVALTAVPSPSAWSAADLSLQELLDQAQAALVELAQRVFH